MAQDNGSRDVDSVVEGDDDEYRDDSAKKAKKVKKKVAKKTVVNVKVAKVDVRMAEDKDQAHGESEYEDEEEDANVQVDDKSNEKVEDEEQLGDKHEQERVDGHEQDIEHEQTDEVAQGNEHEQDEEHADDHHGSKTRRTLKTPGIMKYNDHGKHLFDTELQQHLDGMILLVLWMGILILPPSFHYLRKLDQLPKTLPLTAGDSSSQSDASTGVQPHNIVLPGDKSVCRTTLDDTSALEQQHISDKKFNSYSGADLQESNGSLHNSTLQDSVSTMDPTAVASFEECRTNSHVAPMMAVRGRP
ncbi:hypothetical protein M422DRAFT_264707 [Sphaerobolus stellatus SS14]|uniref:Uncharacterized protein n=1 Tax=Sphaerobolus stellatus (strain SS14) TaxID=990650 RepID=A0A0C9V7B4_SPHS4|nr:hypothetical protein M422DRAFT_264707 [Sphaerobolus stellatus SS14]